MRVKGAAWKDGVESGVKEKGALSIRARKYKSEQIEDLLLFEGIQEALRGRRMVGGLEDVFEQFLGRVGERTAAQIWCVSPAVGGEPVAPAAGARENHFARFKMAVPLQSHGQDAAEVLQFPTAGRLVFGSQGAAGAG